MNNEYEIGITDIESCINNTCTEEIEEKFISIYISCVKPFDYIFAYFHSKLNKLLDWLNYKNKKSIEDNKPGFERLIHYNAAQSRELIELILLINKVKQIANLKYDISMDQCYENTLKFIEPQLKTSGGSQISLDYKNISLIEYKPIMFIKVKHSFGLVKNIIFAANGLKPEIVLDNALENDIKIVKNEDECLIFDLPINNSNLTIGDLKKWWSDKKYTDRLYLRLLETCADGPEKLFFETYYNFFCPIYKDKAPALLPQVYMHYDPKTIKELFGEKRLIHQRMDFLILANGHRIIIEIDGIQHYSDGNSASPSKYAEMVKYDRNMKLHGYEVFRFGGQEFCEKNIEENIKIFFTQLFEFIGISKDD